ncbi:MAG: hypothetical protein HY827_01685 [Actinobacteria bacterium]|nr:hypothetical protein [Actinomycetota bacterium]
MVWEDVKLAEQKPPVRHPNRDLPESQTARLATLALLLITNIALLTVAVGGWSTLVGAKGLHIGFMLAVCIFIGYVVRWNRGVLPVIAAMATILAVFALVAGPAWFARDKTGYADSALPESVLGLITLGLIPLQMLLIVVSMWGFSQQWNIEEEIKPGEPGGPPLSQAPSSTPPSPAPAG